MFACFRAVDFLLITTLVVKQWNGNGLEGLDRPLKAVSGFTLIIGTVPFVELAEETNFTKNNVDH